MSGFQPAPLWGSGSVSKSDVGAPPCGRPFRRADTGVCPYIDDSFKSKWTTIPSRPFGGEVAFARLADFFWLDSCQRCALKLEIKTHDVADHPLGRVGPIVKAPHLNIHAGFDGAHAGVEARFRFEL